MKALYDEVLHRFPEVQSQLTGDDAEVPYVVMGSVIDWLKGIGTPEFAPEIVQRVTEFTKWCEAQPRGDSAANDVYTILVVAFYEELFRSDAVRCLLPHILTKDELIKNAEYLKAWVSDEYFQLALKMY
jgi:hypothetical protein